MKRIITYLLGAGASAECLPIVSRMGEKIGETLRNAIHEFNQHAEKSSDNQITFKEIEEDLKWLQKICASHSSVDTYAKKLYIADKVDEYNRLKRTLSVYFMLAQAFPLEYKNGLQIDRRYDNFWASILNRDQPLPNNMRIISWNYDTQLELSYSNFVEDSIENIYSRLGMLSFYDNVKGFPTDKFAVFKLNGSAKLQSVTGYKSQYFSRNLLLKANRAAFFADLITCYTVLKNAPMLDREVAAKCQLSFAWEHADTITNDYYSVLKESLKDTRVLVVIGYSFPFFNRAIDKKLINDFMPNLDKVYFQAPDAENLRERFLSINGDREGRLMLRSDITQFTFPNELDI